MSIGGPHNYALHQSSNYRLNLPRNALKGAVATADKRAEADSHTSPSSRFIL